MPGLCFGRIIAFHSKARTLSRLQIRGYQLSRSKMEAVPNDAAPCNDSGNGKYRMIAKFGKERIELKNGLSEKTRIVEVKDMLAKRTGVLPKRQKLIGLSLKSGKSSSSIDDDATIGDLKVKAGKKASLDDCIVHQFILMGTPEDKIFIDPSEKNDLPDVVDDFELDFHAGSEEWLQHVANKDNLQRFTDSTTVHIMNPPRDGKPLLVLDLDHTLLDFSSRSLQRDSSTQRVGSGAAAAMKRPYMDEFLTRSYAHFDLVVWSQTSWRWLETKLTELGMLTNPGYRFCFVLDKESMFTIVSRRKNGTSVEHHVKPLQIIWSKFPHWGPSNTVHVDDLSRNFALNMGSGLKVTGFYRKKSASQRDSELLGLSLYLEKLASSGADFENINFEIWMDVVSGKASLPP